MNILGIIAEYNPFHNGHKHHISQAIRQTESEYVIAVISGNFVQRGEPALLEKHIRAQFAVDNGVDLVLELPTVFSSASAEYFAFGGISALHSTGMVTHVAFGCEDTDIRNLKSVADLLTHESDDFSSHLKNILSMGLSYPKARLAAIEKTLNISAEFLAKPNNILAVEYLKALNKLNSPIIPCPVQRTGSAYNDPNLSNKNPSATAIRKFIYDNLSSDYSSFNDLSGFVPENVLNILKSEVINGNIPQPDKFDIHILTVLRTIEAEELRKLPYVSEGLENRLIKASRKACSLDGFFKECASSRYPDARIRRILASILTGVNANLLAEAKNNGIPYLKVLGFNRKGASLLKNMKKTAVLPIITKPAVLNNFSLSSYSHMVAYTESRATDAHNLSLISPKSCGLDYMINPHFSHDLHS